MDAQTTSDILMAVIGVMSLVTVVALVGAVFSMGRSAYRKN